MSEVKRFPYPGAMDSRERLALMAQEGRRLTGKRWAYHK